MSLLIALCLLLVGAALYRRGARKWKQLYLAEQRQRDTAEKDAKKAWGQVELLKHRVLERDKTIDTLKQVASRYEQLTRTHVGATE